MSRREFFDALRQDAGARQSLHDFLLRECHSPIRWESPVLSVTSMEKDFEFAIVSDPALSPVGNYTSFAKKFTGGHVAVFENLRGDATLVVPEPPQNGAQYAHLQAFLHNADTPTAESIWSSVATAAFQRLKRDKYVWVSTAGLGVPWLHFRIDTRPKYICHRPYRGEE